MRLAFYAPMKSPDHPVPSGDRSIARGLIAALRHMGAEVSSPSDLRIRDGVGDAEVQAELKARARSETARVLSTGQSAQWQAWITYHNYYKAPDLIGPVVSRALGIPYVQVEATRARKRLTGPWAGFAQAAEDATEAADAVFYFSARDAIGLKEYAPAGQHLIHLRPFLSLLDSPYADTGFGPMLSVGMMREGDKLASYQIIAETLHRLSHPNWQLDIAGDGPACAQVEALMQPLGAQVRFLGELDANTLQRAYENASLMFWPGVNEALGMVYLEAQAAGLPIVAQDRPGMRDVLAPGRYPAPKEGPAALAKIIDDLLANPTKALKMGEAAHRHVRDHHLMPSAAQTLRDGLAKLGVTA